MKALAKLVVKSYRAESERYYQKCSYHLLGSLLRLDKEYY